MSKLVAICDAQIADWLPTICRAMAHAILTRMLPNYLNLALPLPIFWRLGSPTARLTALALAACVAWPAPAFAKTSTLLRCQVHYGGETQTLDYPPVTDIYAVPATPIGRAFRFKAVLAGEGGRIDYVAIYSYAQTEPWNELLHQVKYLKPALTLTQDPAGLTGQVYVYSRDLHRELHYGCALVEVSS